MTVKCIIILFYAIVYMQIDKQLSNTRKLYTQGCQMLV